jgi:hypothetical protein
MFDIGETTPGSLDVPWDLRIIFGSAYYAGAKIHSNSWGGGYWYDSFCLEVDEFVHSHPDMTLVFAAGNDGNCSIL